MGPHLPIHEDGLQDSSVGGIVIDNENRDIEQLRR
jgi:hypothetical protein